MSVSVRDVAALAGVSVGTVSNVLNRPDKVAPATVAKVNRAITSLGFVRNDAARRLRAGHSSSIGLIVLDVGNPFFAEVARGAEQRAEEAGFAVLLGNSDETPARESRYLDLFREQRVHGVLMSPTTDALEPLAVLTDAGIPVVLVDHEIEGSGLPSVAVDDVEGGRLAAQHLIDTGRRRLAFVGGPLALRQVSQRLAGARSAVAASAGITLEVIEMPALTVLNGRSAGELLAARPASERPDAVFAANDLLAVGVLQALTMLGDIRVPQDIALMGYDDIDFASATVVPLSSIRQPARHIGERAVDLLLRGTVESVRFRPELVVRASTA